MSRYMPIEKIFLLDSESDLKDFSSINENLSEQKQLLQQIVGQQQNANQLMFALLEEKAGRAVFDDGQLSIREWCSPKKDSYFQVIKDKIKFITCPKIKGPLTEVFYGSENLEEIYFNWDEEWFEIEKFAFQHCRKLKYVTLENCKKIWEAAFRCCYGLKRVDGLDGCEEFWDAVFAGADFTSVKLPQTLKKLWRRCFDSCVKLKQIKLPVWVEIASDKNGVISLWKLPKLEKISWPLRYKEILTKQYPWICYEVVDA